MTHNEVCVCVCGALIIKRTQLGLKFPQEEVGHFGGVSGLTEMLNVCVSFQSCG